jgi:hypothetical protein
MNDAQFRNMSDELIRSRQVMEKLLAEVQAIRNITTREQTIAVNAAGPVQFGFAAASILINNQAGSASVNVYPNGNGSGAAMLTVPQGHTQVLNFGQAKEIIYLDNPCKITYSTRKQELYTN